MLAHLREHIEAGQHVPDYCLEIFEERAAAELAHGED
jgi:hypothetical protein